MEINSFINYDVPPVSPEDPVKHVQELFFELTNTHLPVVKDGFLLGIFPKKISPDLSWKKKSRITDMHWISFS